MQPPFSDAFKFPTGNSDFQLGISDYRVHWKSTFICNWFKKWEWKYEKNNIILENIICNYSETPSVSPAQSYGEDWTPVHHSTHHAHTFIQLFTPSGHLESLIHLPNSMILGGGKNWRTRRKPHRHGKNMGKYRPNTGYYVKKNLPKSHLRFFHSIFSLFVLSCPEKNSTDVPSSRTQIYPMSN